MNDLHNHIVARETAKDGRGGRITLSQLNYSVISAASTIHYGVVVLNQTRSLPRNHKLLVPIPRIGALRKI